MPPRPRKEMAVRAAQVAMDLDTHVARRIKVLAALEDMTPQDYIRQFLGLDFKPAKRPRLSLSLSADDYGILASRYGLNADQHTAIKAAIVRQLYEMVMAEFANHEKPVRPAEEETEAGGRMRRRRPAISKE